MSLMQNLWDQLKQVRQEAAGAPVEHILATMVPKARVHHESDPFPTLVAGDQFEAGGSYFGIRLAGVNLAQARRFATRLLPLCVCLAEFGRPGAERTVPFSIGPNAIRQRLKAAGISDAEGAEQAWIELRDVTVLRPTPVGRGNLSLFVGLYAVPGDDVVRTLLNVMSDLGGSLGAAGLAPAVQTAKAVYGGFGALLGLNNVHPQAEALNGRALPGTGSGYMLVAHAPAGTLEQRDLCVREGALRDPKGKLVVDFDYCLVAIEHYASIVESATATAPDLFEDAAASVQKALDDADQAGYARALNKLIGQIQASNEVIEADKDRLVSGYGSLFEKRAKQRLPQPAAGRGAGVGLGLNISSQQAMLRKDNRKPELSKALFDIYGFISKPADREEKSKGNETSAELWSAVCREAVAIEKSISTKPQPGEIAAAFARAAQTMQPPL